jgi:hypothetical protein
MPMKSVDFADLSAEQQAACLLIRSRLSDRCECEACRAEYHKFN